MLQISRIDGDPGLIMIMVSFLSMENIFAFTCAVIINLKCFVFFVFFLFFLDNRATPLQKKHMNFTCYHMFSTCDHMCPHVTTCAHM